MDETSLKPNLQYDVSRDKVIGFEDLGEEKLRSPACNVAVLMLKGLCNNWKLPLSYFFLKSTFPANKLKLIIIKTIEKLHEVQFKIITFITMGGNFMQQQKLGDYHRFCIL